VPFRVNIYATAQPATGQVLRKKSAAPSQLWEPVDLPTGGGPHAATHATGQGDAVSPAAIGAAAASHAHAPGDVTGTAVVTADSRLTTHDSTKHSVAYEVAANKGAALGYASLDAGGKVPAAQLPASGSAADPLLRTRSLGTLAINTGEIAVVMAGGVTLTGSQRITLAGTGRMRVL
jgi:hypothetical protein